MALTLKGCALRLLLIAASLAAIVIAIGAALVRWYGTSPVDVIGVSILGGLLAWFAAVLLTGAVNAWRERASLLAGMAGTPPVDGRPAILVGQIEPLGATVRAPLSALECVAYTYEIYEMQLAGKSRTKVLYCDGVGLTPSVIVTRAGSFRLLAVPELDCDDADLDRDAALARASEYMLTLPFEPTRPSTQHSIEAQWNDDDGAYRRDRRRVEDHVDLSACKMSERRLERGARVCVFGRYSAAKRGIVADPNDWSKITRVMKGEPDAIARQLRTRLVRNLIGTVFFGGVAVAVIAAFVSNLR